MNSGQSGGGGPVRSVAASVALSRARAEYRRLQEEESAHAAASPFAARLRAPPVGEPSSGALPEAAAEKLRRARQLRNQLRSAEHAQLRAEPSSPEVALDQRADALAAMAERDGSEPGTGARREPHAPDHGAQGPAEARFKPLRHRQLAAPRAPRLSMLEEEAEQSKRRRSASGVPAPFMSPSRMEIASYKLDLFLSRPQSKYLLLLAVIAAGLALGTLVLLPLVASGQLADDHADGDGGSGVLYPLFASLWLAWTFMADPGAHADALHDASALAKLAGALVSALGILLGAAVIALLVEAVHAKIEELMAGSLRVPESGHVCILGWSAQAVPLIRELCEANASDGGGVIVVVADTHSKREMEAEAAFLLTREALQGTRVLFRSATTHLLATLTAVRAHAAKAIVVLSDPTIAPSAADAHTLRTVLALRTLPCEPTGHVVAEVNSVDCEPALQLVGAAAVEPVVVDVLVGRLLVVCAQNPGLAACYECLLGFFGDELYFKEWPELVGRRFGHVMRSFPHAVPVGVKRAAPPAGSGAAAEADGAALPRLLINPPDEYVMQPGDELLVVAEDDGSYALAESGAPEPLPAHMPQPKRPAAQRPQQLLIVGWRRDLPMMLHMLEQIVAAGSVAHVLCEVDLADREQASADLDSAPIVNGQQDLGRLTVLHHVGNSMSRRHLSRLPVEAMDSILVLADEELTASEALQSDSRCLASLLLCWDVSSQARTDGLARTWAASGAQARPAAGAKGASGRRVSSDFADMSVSRRFSPKASQAEQQILCEILDFRTRDILHQDASIVNRFDFLLSNAIMSKVLAMVTEDRAIKQVLLEMLQPGGSEMLVRPYAEFEAEVAPLSATLSFWDLSAFLRGRGDILVGFKRFRELPVLNPKDKHAPLNLTTADSVVVFSPAHDTPCDDDAADDSSRRSWTAGAITAS